MLVMGGGAVMFAAGVSWWYFGTVIGSVAGLIYAVFASRGTPWQMIKDYQFRRIDTFLDPTSDPLGAGYNIIQAQIALGSGGWAGKGFMQGSQSQLNFLPEKHTDFIFTTLAEEFGFVGAISLLALYALIIGFCILSAMQNRDRYAALADLWHRHGVLPVLRGQHVDGDGPDPGRRRAPAAGVLRRNRPDDPADGLRAGAVGPCPPPAMRVRVFFAAGADLWPAYRAPLTQALRDAGLDAALSDTAPDPAAVDYIVFAPGGIIADFTPYTRCKAVLNLWAGVEKIAPNVTLTQPLCRMVDPAMTETWRNGSSGMCCGTIWGWMRTSSGRMVSGGTPKAPIWHANAR